MGQQAGQGQFGVKLLLRTRFPGGRTLCSRWSAGPRREQGQGLGLGWVSAKSLLARRQHPEH